MIALPDSRSWTPKLLTDLVKGKKQSREQNEDLQLLPENRMIIHEKTSHHQETPIGEQKAEKMGNENALFGALSFIEETLFCSDNRFDKIDMSNNFVAQTLDYLFSNEYTKND